MRRKKKGADERDVMNGAHTGRWARSIEEKIKE
jgi:hypothetical protein